MVRNARRATVAMSIFAFALLAARADTVVLRDGAQITGEVLGFDAERLNLRDSTGSLVVLPRARISRILFDAAAPPLKVEVRCAAGDDEMDLLLNGDIIVERADLLGSGWVDISDRLRPGNNELRVRVRNERVSWAYRWELRVNGKVKVFSCGQLGVKGKGCSCCGLRGDETGLIDRIDPVWLNVDRGAGSAEVVGQ